MLKPSIGVSHVIIKGKKNRLTKEIQNLKGQVNSKLIRVSSGRFYIASMKKTFDISPITFS